MIDRRKCLAKEDRLTQILKGKVSRMSIGDYVEAILYFARMSN